jgi:hypothetical protein
VPAALIPTVLLTLVYLLVPGAGISLSTGITRGRGPVTFLAVSLGCGYAAVASLSLVLALVGTLTLPAIAIGWTLASGGVWFAAITSGAVGAHTRDWHRAVADAPWTSIATVATVVGVVAVRWTYPPLTNLGATAMRYWADAMEIADAKGIPADTLQWGALLRPTTSKSVLNTFNAGFSLLTGRGPLESMSVLLFVVAISLVIVTIALLMTLGVKRLAPIGAVVLFVNHVTGSELTADLGRNLAENWGRLAAFAGVLVAILVLGRSSKDEQTAEDSMGEIADEDRVPRGHLAIAGWVLGTAAGTHLVAAAFGALFVLSYVIARMVLRRSPMVTLRRAAAFASVALVVASLSLVLPAGDLGFGGAVGDAEYRSLRSELGLPESFDPTRFLVTGKLQAPAGTETIGVKDVAEAFAYRAVGRNVQVLPPGSGPLPSWALTVPFAVVLVIVIAVIAWGPPDLRVTVLSASFLALLIFAVGVAFALRYDLYALERFGNRRLFNYAMLPYVVVLLAGGEAVLRGIAARGRTYERTVSIAACGLVIVTLVGFLPAAGWPKASKAGNLRQQIQLLQWVKEHVPCEGRVLADRRTLATFQTMAGHAAVLEGMGPHLRPEVLVRAIGELLRAKTFFEDPQAQRRYLEERGVAVVVATRPFAEFAGWIRVLRLPPNPFRDIGYLRPVYRSHVGTVFLVEGWVPNPSLPAVGGRPGFRCPPG